MYWTEETYVKYRYLFNPVEFQAAHTHYLVCWLFQVLKKLQRHKSVFYVNTIFDYTFERIWFKRNAASDPITVYNGWDTMTSRHDYRPS